MIIDMEDYRRIDSDSDASMEVGHDLRRRAYSNAVPALQLATVESETERFDAPEMPDDFDDVDAREFIERAYGLATQI